MISAVWEVEPSALERENARLRDLLDDIHRGKSAIPPRPTRYDSATTEARAADRGKRIAAGAHQRDLQIARDIAREVYLRGCIPICADDVRATMLRRFPDTEWGNWAGSIFAGDEWVSVGLTRSKVAGSHANLLRTWRLR